MQYLYNLDAGREIIEITDSNYNYLFRARRHRVDSLLNLRNLKDDNLYTYKVAMINRSSAKLELMQSKKSILIPRNRVNLYLAIIDFNELKELVPLLNNLGVGALTLFRAEYSQDIKIDLEKLNRINIASSQQSGRSNIIEIKISSFEEIVQNENLAIFDFSGTTISRSTLLDFSLSDVMIGPEGGFSDTERVLLGRYRSFKVDNLILKAFSAAAFVASIAQL